MRKVLVIFVTRICRFPQFSFFHSLEISCFERREFLLWIRLFFQNKLVSACKRNSIDVQIRFSRIAIRHSRNVNRFKTPVEKDFKTHR